MLHNSGFQSLKNGIMECAITELETGKCTSTCEGACELEFAHCYLINFTYATCT